jgi:2,3-bisphosphoglycerate-independent phosphoglycerate mutase
MNRLIFFFLDGVGIGKAADSNPFYVAKTEFLPFYDGGLSLPDGTPVKKIDATLGVEGIPQSASGQTSLYTGENIPKILGQHKDSYPTRAMRKIIIEKNILSRLKENGLDAVFINAYPMHRDLFTEEHVLMHPSGEFHFSPEFPPAFKRRISATSCMMLAAKQIPFDETDILAERSIFQDYSNRWLIEKGLHVPEFTPGKAAEILFNASRRHDFILYEYFQTDLYGHRHTFDEQLQLIKNLNLLVGSLLSRLDPQTDTLLLTSDHGNLEDSTTRAHTLNPVPLITWGNQSDFLRDQINDLTDVSHSILGAVILYKNCWGKA